MLNTLAKIQDVLPPSPDASAPIPMEEMFSANLMVFLSTLVVLQKVLSFHGNFSSILLNCGFEIEI